MASVPIVPDAQVGLAIFGSLVTEMSPPDLPEGVSPDNQDVEFYPGGVRSRACLHKRTIAFTPGTTITHADTYLQPNGEPLNIFLLSDGTLWEEDVTHTPNEITQIGQVTPGSYCNSTTALGRFYMAFHDGKNPTDIPLQYDGTNLDRVSQNGPGSPCTMNDAIAAPIPLALISMLYGTLTIVSVTEVGLTVTVVVATPHNLFVGDQVLVNTGDVILNNLYQPITIEAIPTASSFSYTVGVPNIPVQSSGTVVPLVVTLLTSTPHGLITGDGFTIAGTSSFFDNNYTQNIALSSLAIASISEVGNTVTVVLVTSYLIAPGLQILVATGNSTYDQGGVLITVVDVLSPNTFTYIVAQTGAPTLTSGTVVVTITITAPAVWTVRTATPPDGLTFTGVYTHAPIGTPMGALTPGGLSSEGPHQAVVLFRTRNGAITQASTPITFTSAGNRKYAYNNLPIGPPDVIARIIAISGSQGSNFFYSGIIPMGVDITGTRVAIGTSTVINDNTSTSGVIDIADNTLFASTAIDIPGNNLFRILPISGCIGQFFYASRMFWWGFFNSITNLLNMGFEGGYNVLTTPLGWQVLGPGGILVTSPTADGCQSWQITGDGTAAKRGFLSQSGYTDFYGVSILQPNTQYTFKTWIQASAGAVLGNFVIDFYSPSAGLLAQANPTTASLPRVGGFISIDFSAVTSAVIPADTVVRIYTTSLNAGETVTLDEMQVVPTQDSVGLQYAVSYVNNPEAFDGVTGRLGATDDPTPIQCSFEHHDSLHFLTSSGLHSTRDIASSEPSGWPVIQISNRCGAASPRACDVGENFAVWLSAPIAQPPVPRGIYIYGGGEPLKISQENQPIIDSINSLAQQSIWAKCDLSNRRMLFGIPIGAEATAPNQVYVIDHLELNTASDIANRPPIHISFTGKMICSDLSRKSTKWNVAANCAQVMAMPGGGVQLCVGGGNGETPGQSPGFAGLYWFDPSKLTDDDYGVVVPYYITYFFVNHELEVALQVGLGRKIYKAYSSYVLGVGLFPIQPYANSLTNPRTNPLPRALSLAPLFDLGGGLNVSAERCAFRLGSAPLPGQTDNKFDLQKFIVNFRKEPISPMRYGAV